MISLTFVDFLVGVDVAENGFATCSRPFECEVETGLPIFAEHKRGFAAGVGLPQSHLLGFIIDLNPLVNLVVGEEVPSVGIKKFGYWFVEAANDKRKDARLDVKLEVVSCGPLCHLGSSSPGEGTAVGYQKEECFVAGKYVVMCQLATELGGRGLGALSLLRKYYGKRAYRQVAAAELSFV